MGADHGAVNMVSHYFEQIKSKHRRKNSFLAQMDFQNFYPGGFGRDIPNGVPMYLDTI
jgi:hypothetical protein